MRTLTIGLWLVSLVVLAVAAVIVVEMGFIATSIDPVEIATNGLDPWTDALLAASGFVGLGVTTAMALRLWHSVRFKAIGLILTALDIGCVAGGGVWFYREYS